MSVFFRRSVGCCLAAFAAVITLLQVNQKSFVLGSGMRKARRGKSGFFFFDAGSCIKPHSIAFIFIYLVAQTNASRDARSLWQLPEGEEHISN